jgi:hypothetical protein
MVPAANRVIVRVIIRLSALVNIPTELWIPAFHRNDIDSLAFYILHR